MANFIAWILGLLALLVAIVGFLPLLGWLNWLNVPLVIAGIAFGIASDSNSGRNFCIFVAIVSAARLAIGGGII